MDSVSRIGEALSDVGAAERVTNMRRQTGNERRGAKKRKPQPGTPSGGGREPGIDEGCDRPQQPDDEASVDRERSEACYARDKTVAPILPKGRLIDVAI